MRIATRAPIAYCCPGPRDDLEAGVALLHPIDLVVAPEFAPDDGCAVPVGIGA